MHRHLVLAIIGVAICVASGSCRGAVTPPPEPDFARLGVDQPSGLYCSVVGEGAPDAPRVQAPEVIAAYWDRRRAYEHRALIAAPAEIAADWATVAAYTRNELTPAIEALHHAAIPSLPEPSAVTGARVRIALVDAGCRGAMAAP